MFLVAVRWHRHDFRVRVARRLLFGWFQQRGVVITENPQALVVGEVQEAVAAVRKQAGDFGEGFQRLRATRIAQVKYPNRFCGTAAADQSCWSFVWSFGDRDVGTEHL